MKKIFSLIIFFAAFLLQQASAQSCCPEFELQFKRDRTCLFAGSCPTTNGESNFTASMCKYSTNTFLVTPNLVALGFTYSWTVTGGSPATPTGNPMQITWGGGSTGTVTVTITSADGKCKKTIKETICLRDAPQASFTFTKDYVCAGTPISFTNTSVGGVSIYWDFGDGGFATVDNPSHTYINPGNYPVTIYVSNSTDDSCGRQNPTGGVGKPCCGCISIFKDTVHILPGTPLSIIPKKCVNQCLCAGDTAEYCASKICAPYNWSISGGNIISGLGTSCVKVVWTGPYPTKLTLVQPGCGASCSDTSVLNVPVLVNGIPISPSTPLVCSGSTQTYFLPAMPGAFYTWTVVGGTIIGPSINTPTIGVLWNGPGTGSVSCSYQNPLKPGCTGSTSMPVTIKDKFKIQGGPLQTCVGCTSNFFANGTANWTISPGGASVAPPFGANTVVSYTAPGTYTLLATASPANFCNLTDDAKIVVAAKPILSITPTTAKACPGTIVKFVVTSNITTVPLTWTLPTGATMIGNTGPILDTAVIQLGPIPPGGVTVSASQQCAYSLSCSQTTVSATINLPAAPQLTPGLVTKPCIDKTENYTISNYISGIYYTWAIVDGAGNPSNLGTITNGQGTGAIQVLWHGNATNLASITVTNCAGTATLPIQVVLPVFPTITATGSCFNPGITLTSSPALPSNTWSTGQTGASIVINGPGSYTVTVVGTGSCQTTATINIPPSQYWVKIIPPCIVYSCNPNSLSVQLTQTTNASPTNCKWLYQPPGGGGYTVVSTVCGNYIATNLGSYYEVIIDPNGCSDTSNIIRIPQDINICCASGACASIPANAINFTHTGCSPTNFTGTFTLPPGWNPLPVTYCYGDGTSTTGPSLNATHQYAAAGLYTACIIRKVWRPGAAPLPNDTCCVSQCHDVTIPVVTKITASFDCNTGKLIMSHTGSTYYPSNATAVYTWTYSGPYTGTITNGVGQTNQLIYPTASGPYTITLSITLNGCTSTATYPINVVIPAAPITINPNPSCFGSPVYFNCPLNGMAQYYWQFGDGSFSYLQAPEHIYTATGTYTVVLQTTTIDGCIKKDSLKVTIQPRPIVTLSPKPITICPGTTATITASINPNGNTMCPALSNYSFQWYNDGTAIGSPVAPGPFTVNSYGNYYAVLTGTGSCNCKIITDTVLVKMYPKPVAKILGNSTLCMNGGTGSIYLSNSYGGYPGYAWSSNNPGNVSFAPSNAAGTTVTINAPGNYQIYLTVTDAFGCLATDTFCIYANNSPSVYITGPGGALCQGNTNTLQAIPSPLTASPLGYTYQWSNMATTPSINASMPGSYSVAILDLNTGCGASSNTITVNKKAYLSLFPSCCDTICDNAPINIVAPLPVAVGQNPCTIYNIVWQDNGVPLSPQPPVCNTLNTATLLPLLGQHNLSIVVTINGCTDTSNVFNLYIKHCGDCGCDGSHWGEINLQEGINEKHAKGDPVHGVDVKLGAQNKSLNSVVTDPTGTTLKCNGSYTLKCNQPYTINASYICKDTACTGKVTYSLQPPTGMPITGPAPVIFTPTISGTYTLTLYGWCNGKKCDSCVIKFTVKCDPDCCKGSHWGEITLNQGENIPNAAGNVPTPLVLNCGKDYTLKCNQPYSVNASFICATKDCNAEVTYNLLPPMGAAITGAVPFTFTPTQNGIYTLTLYGWCAGKICDSCVIKFKVECKDCCKGSYWKDGPNWTNDKTGKTSKIKCNDEKPYTITGENCNTSFTVSGTFVCADKTCQSNVVYNLYDANTNAVVVGPSNNTITIPAGLPNGAYYLTIYAYCGSMLCDTCSMKIIKDCHEEECDCKGSHWGEITLTPKQTETGTGTTTGTTTGNNTAASGPKATGGQTLNCGKEYIVKCKKTYVIDASYICAKPNCQSVVKYQMSGPMGTSSGNLAYNFTPTISGTYTLLLYGYCGGKLCDTCKITFKVDCPVDTACCPYQINVSAKDPTYTVVNAGAATMANTNFVINGLGTANITEVRANVISYMITDNYGKECMKCVNLPFTWASTASATSIGAIAGQVTMFGGTMVPSFAGTGTGVYQNPREVIWNNGTNFSIPNNTSVGMNFLLPPPPTIDCCEFKGRICVKFTFRDDHCKECEVIACFDMVIKKK